MALWSNIFGFHIGTTSSLDAEPVDVTFVDGTGGGPTGWLSLLEGSPVAGGPAGLAAGCKLGASIVLLVGSSVAGGPAGT